MVIGVMKDFFDALSVIILFSSFMLMAGKKTRSYIRTFRFQSLLIAVVAGITGVESLASKGSIEVLVVCVLIVVLKVIYIPNLLERTYSNVDYKIEKDFFYNIPMLVIICCGLVVFSYFCVSGINVNTDDANSMQIVNSLSVVLIGFFFMISRKKAIGQIIGFLVVENGLFVMAMFTTHGMPFIVDMGVLVDLLTAVMIMGIMVFRINDKFDSTNINKLNNLKG
jgi:hydrogenase-4 component E